MSYKVKLEDLKELKVTRVTSYKIYFKYKDICYMLIDESDDDACISLYKRLWVKKDRLNLVKMGSTISSGGMSQFIKDISKKRPAHLVYSNIDREFFVKKLVEMGFVSGIYDKQYKEAVGRAEIIRAEIRKLQNQVSDIYKEWRDTHGIGSKQYGIELKTKVADRVKGAKEGEWCEEYNAYYGDIHPEYGGVLTDLFSLHVGDWFTVANGWYDAYIGVNKHGDKCVVTDKSCVKLTKDKHSAYIYQGEKDEEL
ncbi:MAG: hypothetical protein J6A59_06370 [Lachnospiraceae bacterium]|nr:hypothetical protein [Lachnospiraceae bacterium]